MERTILHSDLNNFYASVEVLDHPELKGKPVAVCGDPELRHGIVLAKSQEAKKLGVKTGEAIWQAKQHCRTWLWSRLTMTAIWPYPEQCGNSMCSTPTRWSPTAWMSAGCARKSQQCGVGRIEMCR